MGGGEMQGMDEVELAKAKEMSEMQGEPYLKQHRFVSGQLFASGAAIASLVANMLYNPSLGSMVRSLLTSRLVIIPVPDEWKGQTFEELWEFMLKKRNLVVMGL